MRQLQSLLVLTFLFLPGSIQAQTAGEGTVTGIVVDQATRAPLEHANVVLLGKADSSLAARTMTDKEGRFTFTPVSWGVYAVECSFIGHRTFRSSEFRLTSPHSSMDLQTISLTESAFALDEVVITSERNLFNHTIDRKVYNVDRDLMAKSSTVSELLQNIPSVQVDIDGNVSLRGSLDVMILINGKQSPLMGKSRADVLQQLPASSIEKIEVITNPSARFTPEGTSGIINIVMKKGAGSGLNGNVTGHLGTMGRHNASVDFNYNPGTVNVFGSYTFRDDLRRRSGTDAREYTGASSGPVASYREDNQTTMRPRVHMATLGMSYEPGSSNTFELTADYFHRKPVRDGISTIVTRDDNDVILLDYDRVESGYESEGETGVTAAFQHNFPKKDHELRVEANVSSTPQKESTHFTDGYRVPAGPSQQSDILLDENEKQGQLNIDYADPLDEDSKLEAGYALEMIAEDVRSDADYLDLALQEYLPDPAKTYRFKLDQAIHAVYGTYEHSLGRIDLMGGLRTEFATVNPDLVTTAMKITNRYSGLYPTLHLTYKLAETREVRLSYSRRINRPEGDMLNPFPEYADPYNIEAGNPYLKPESIHSIELGYQWRNERVSFVPTVYYRYKQDGFTRVTQSVNDSTLLRTMMNLASDWSAGLEPVLTASLGSVLAANLNGNVFYEQIDASNIGYSQKKSVVSWSGTLNVNLKPVRTTVFQVNANYRSARLTPQGESRPSFGLNLGVRQDLLDEKLSLTLAVSDLLKTQRQEIQLDISGIQQSVANRRDSQIVYFGVTYHYGRPEKKGKGKEKTFQYDEQP